MMKIIVQLLSTGMMATILIIITLLARKIFKGRLPARVFVYLWMVAALRLLVPISFEIPNSWLQHSPVHQVVNEASRTIISTTTQSMTGEQTSADENMPLQIIEPRKVDTTVKQAAAPDDETARKTDRSFAAEVTTSSDSAIVHLWKLLGLVIALGTIFTFLYLSLSGRDERRILDEALPMTYADRERIFAYVKEIKSPVCRIEDYGFRDDGSACVPMRFSDRISTPVTGGFIRPFIVFSKNMTAECPKQLGFVLMHEIIHIRRRDNLLKLIAVLAVSLHWYNPFAWVMLHYLGRDMEVSCDEKVLAASGREEREDYASSMLLLAQTKHAGLATLSGFGKNDMKERIVMIMKYRQKSHTVIMAGILMVFLSFSVFTQSNEVTDKDTDTTVSAKVETLEADVATEIETETSSSGLAGKTNNYDTWIRCTYYNSDGEEVTIRERELDENGNIISSAVHCPSGVPAGSITEFTLDENGNPASGITTFENGEKQEGSTKYICDENGHIIKILSLDEQGQVTWTDEYKYDEYGNEVEYKNYSPDGQITAFNVTTYEYAADGRINKSEITSNLEEEVAFGSEESYSKYQNYLYDEMGRIQQESFFDSDGGLIGWQIYEYPNTNDTSSGNAVVNDRN